MSEHNVARCVMQKGDLESAKPLLDRQHAFYLTTQSWWMTAKYNIIISIFRSMLTINLSSHSILAGYAQLIGDFASSRKNLERARYLLETQEKAGKHPLCGSIYFKLGRLCWLEATRGQAPFDQSSNSLGDLPMSISDLRSSILSTTPGFVTGSWTGEGLLFENAM